MELKDYNIKLVKLKMREDMLQPINDCIVNGNRYISDPNETDEKKIYLPTKELEFGCVMSMPQQKRTWIIKLCEFSFKRYIEIYQVPYKENADYSYFEISKFIHDNYPNDTFVIEK